MSLFEFGSKFGLNPDEEGVIAKMLKVSLSIARAARGSSKRTPDVDIGALVWFIAVLLGITPAVIGVALSRSSVAEGKKEMARVEDVELIPDVSASKLVVGEVSLAGWRVVVDANFDVDVEPNSVVALETPTFLFGLRIPRITMPGLDDVPGGGGREACNRFWADIQPGRSGRVARGGTQSGGASVALPARW